MCSNFLTLVAFVPVAMYAIIRLTPFDAFVFASFESPHRFILELKSWKSRFYAALVRLNRSCPQSTCIDESIAYLPHLEISRSMSHCANSYAKDSSVLSRPYASNSPPSKSHGLHRSITIFALALRSKRRKSCSKQFRYDNNRCLMQDN